MYFLQIVDDRQSYLRKASFINETTGWRWENQPTAMIRTAAVFRQQFFILDDLMSVSIICAMNSLISFRRWKCCILSSIFLLVLGQPLPLVSQCVPPVIQIPFVRMRP
jgi:hypothetical protein